MENHFSIAEPEYIVQSILGGTSWEMMSQLGPPEVEPESFEIYPRTQVIYWGWNTHNFKKHI